MSAERCAACDRHSVWCSIGEDGPPLPCCSACPGSYQRARIARGGHVRTGTGWPR